MSLNRVHKLIALAESTHSEEEARTASREAVRLIAKLGLLKQEPQQTRHRRPEPLWNGPIVSKWASKCELCGKAVLGSNVVWLQNRVRHYGCHARSV